MTETQADDGTRWAVAAYVYTALVAASLALFMYDIPVQVTDCLNQILNVQGRTHRELLQSYGFQAGFLRPFSWAEIKVIYEAAGGRYHEWFRGIHAAEAAGLLFLCTGLIRPRTRLDAMLVPLALAMLVGMHTFAGTVREAFPINNYLMVVVCCFAVAHLAFANRRWWSDAAAVAIFVLILFSIESGVLVWVVAVAAFLVGRRGVSGVGIAVMSLVLAGYFVLRFGVLQTGTPGLVERASGFGFGVLEPRELIARFGDAPGLFYAYNAIASALTVLLTEPRAGVFRFVSGLREGEVPLPIVANVVSSMLASAVLVAYAWRRRADWRRRRFTRDDQLVLVFAAVLGANAVLSFAYTKDVLMSPAGAFYAVAGFVAVRSLAERASAWAGMRRAAAAVIVLMLAVAWSYRAAGIYAGLHDAALTVRYEWALVDEWLAEQHVSLERPDARALMQQLQADAVWRFPGPAPLPGETARLLDFDQ